MRKKWLLPAPDPVEVDALASLLRIAPVTAQLLVNRGLSDPDRAEQFLQPSLHELADPCEFPVVTDAARFLIDAVRAGRRIAIYGDYDADGICAAALLLRCLRYLGTDAELYIPHRVDEGYGLSCEALDELAAAGTELVVTVDCGICAVAEVDYARRLGIEVLVTDHHEPGEELPAAAHVLNPKLPEGGGFGYDYLAGVGVAFKLVWAVGQELSPGHRVSDEFRELLMEALSLVAIGTVADVVPLVDENRVLTHYGLHSLAEPSRPGLRALIAVSRLRNLPPTAQDVAFRLAPRLNAAGRMGDARAAVEMLTTADERHAGELAEHLERQNRLRRSTQQSTLGEAEQKLARGEALAHKHCILLADPAWHQGVVGLVASRLAEKHGRPAFVFVRGAELACGSGRSVTGFALLTAVRECADLLERFGGHKGAAGVTLPAENLPAFAERMDELAGRFFGQEPPAPVLELDGEIELASLSAPLVREMERLEPFGRGNPAPLLATCGLRVAGNPRIVGRAASHLAFMVNQGGATLRVIAMGKVDWLEELRARRGETFSLAYAPQIDTYRATMAVELRAEDMQWDAERAAERR